MKTIKTLILSLVMMLAAQGAWADTLYVDVDPFHCGGSIYCTIQEAVTAATDGDTIEIAAGHYDEHNIITGDKGLAFIGADRSTTIIDGGGFGNGVFNISTSTTTRNISFSRLTIQNGSQDSGGGIFILQGTVVIDDCTLTGNSATGNNGGAIYFSLGDLTISNSDISGNAAANLGGAIDHYAGTLTIDNTNISSNSAQHGGAIYRTVSLGVISATILTNSTIENNQATNFAGAYYADDLNTLTITNSSFSNNSAPGYAGAIYLPTGDLTITNSTINANKTTLSYAGAILHGVGNLTITDSDITSNLAHTGQGGILHAGAGTVTIDGSNISNNATTSGLAGGAEFADATVTITDSVMDANQSASAAGIWQPSGDLTIIRSTISNNIASVTGGGIYYSNPTGNLVIEDSTITKNQAGGVYGGIYQDGNMLMTGSTVSENETSGNAGGIYVKTTARIVNSTISGNTATYRTGGIEVEGTASFNNVTIANNEVSASGSPINAGGLYIIFPATVTLQNTILSGNVDPNFGDDDCSGELTSAGYNLIENASANCIIGGDATGNITGKSAKLSSLADHGGDTETHVLEEESPAIDKGNPAGCEDGASTDLIVDQRGVERPLGLACDIGAVEVGCGDGVIQGDEECDDGNDKNTDSCTNACTSAVCGDSFKQSGEECDDGNTKDDDGCDSSCKEEADVDDNKNSSANSANGSGGGCSLRR